MRPSPPVPGARGVGAGSLAAPTLRLLACGALVVLASHLLPAAPATTASALDVAGAAGEPPPDDDELLLRIGRAAVAADDPVVGARLLKLARYLELGGTGEHADDELVAVAREVGLGGEDVVIRRYLVEAARLAIQRPVAADAPDEDAIREYHASHAERFTNPPRLRATHVYLSAARRGVDLERDADRLLDELRVHGASPEASRALGDPFVRGATVAGSEDALARSFGASFAREVAALPVGGWHGPIASSYGLHLVWVEERAPARLAPLEEVRGRVVHALLRARGEARARERLAALRRGSGGAGDDRRAGS